MSILANFSNVMKHYGSQEVLTGIDWQLQDRTRAALVGRNGTGKTTLFRLLGGEIQPDNGNLIVRPGAVIATMEQEMRAEDGRTLREEASRGLKHIEELQEEFDRTTYELSQVKEGDAHAEKLLDRYGYLEERLQQVGAYSAEARVKSVLSGLHFTDADLDRPLLEFSGGQKNRAGLAKVLLRDPDLLLLDEPTNHLDLDAIEWLENFLDTYQGAYLIVSHDKVFLNRLSKQVLELRNGKLTTYIGNYDDFLEERERRLEDHLRRYELQQAEIRRDETFVAKNLARASTTKRAQSRRNRLERMERIQPPEWPASSIKMRLPEASRSAKNVLEVKDLGMRYGDVQVFQHLSFLLLRGQKVGLVGPNGVGKTTLLSLIMEEMSPTEGSVRLGPGVEIAYYEQEQTAMRGPQTVIDEVWQITPAATESEVRGFLGAFLFRGSDVYKSLNQLSGGEKSRVALAKLVRGGANFLILDEPTNHLDLESRAVMEKALAAFTGTLLVATHDRALLDKVVDHVLEITATGCKLYEGGFQLFNQTRSREEAGIEAASASKTKAAKANGSATEVGSKGSKANTSAAVDPKREYQEAKQRKRDEAKLKRRVNAAESNVVSLEEEKESIELSMADPAISTDSEKLAELAREHKMIKSDLADAISEWERLANRLEAFRDQF